MSKPNQRKQQKKNERQQKVRQQQHKASDNERIETLLFSADQAFFNEQYTIAEQHCRSILNTQPENLKALEMYSRVLVKLEKQTQLLAVFEKLKMLAPEEPNYHYNYAVTLYTLGKYKESVDYATEMHNYVKIPRDLMKNRDELIKIADFKRYAQKHSDFTAIQKPAKVSPNKKQGDKTQKSLPVQTAAPTEDPAPVVFTKIEVPITTPQIKFTTDLYQDSVSIEKNAIFWLGCLLSKEHERMQSEFEELLCINHTVGVTHFGYQTETVRKVLKMFHGRVLLSDEVGLGKTIEAAMVLKEYLLRGMVKTVLILCPPSLIEQWHTELSNKFNIQAHRQNGTISAKLSKTFWNHNIIIASLHTAKNTTNIKMVTEKSWDMVIVDEAHHVRNKKTLSWKFINSLQKKYILLLSATPVQNDLIELYNLITLLKPGVFPPEKEFIASYCESKNRRKPKKPMHYECSCVM